jgi:hypothetical protein
LPASEGLNADRVLYGRLLARLPEAATLPEGEGVILHYANGRELHANRSRGGETVELILAFYYSGSQAVPEEQACYEVQLDHAAKMAHATPLRQEQEQPLFSRLAQLGVATGRNIGNGFPPAAILPPIPRFTNTCCACFPTWKPPRSARRERIATYPAFAS